MHATTLLSSPSRGGPGSAASSGIALAYSMDSEPSSAAVPTTPQRRDPRRRQPPPQRSAARPAAVPAAPPSPLSPYAFTRSERAPGEAPRDEDSVLSDRSSDGAASRSYRTPEARERSGLTPVREGEEDGGDATATVRRRHRQLLRLLSRPELFQRALEWEDRLDRGLDPAASGTEGDGAGRGEEGNPQGATRATHSQNETFEFDPNNGDDSGSDSDDDSEDGDSGDSCASEEEDGQLPLPHRIFAADAEAVLPAALTASELFGVERVTGMALEAAVGRAAVSRLFLRWLALMPAGDHTGAIAPPGLTVMKVKGGGYRATGAHRVVWRWMNKFSPQDAGPHDAEATMDFDCGDLVALTVIDVFETDAAGRLLSYCPTFDNRAVRRTPEMAERLRQGAGRLRARFEGAARSPAGRGVNQVGRMSLRAALVVGNAVRNRVQQQQQHYRSGHEAPEEDQLNELLQSQIATDDSDLDGSDATAPKEAPAASSPLRRMEV